MKRWLKEFCNTYYLKKYNKAFYLDDDDMMEPTLELFFYNCYRHFRGWQPIYKIRMIWQFLTRKDHIPDCWVWDVHYQIAKRTLPLLMAYKKYDRHGYPSIYSQFNQPENEEEAKWMNDGCKTIEKWKETHPDCIGGEMEAWNKDIDEMIFALEYTLNKDDWKSEFWKKYYGEYLDEKKESNRHVHIHYKLREKDPGCYVGFGENSAPEGAIIQDKSEFYINDKMEKEASERAQKGLELFAKRFFNLWD